MWVHEDRDVHISQQIRESGQWEPYESKLVSTLLAPGQTFIDIGANIGYYTLLAARRVGSLGSVFAFEPEARNFGLLQRNLELNEIAGWVTASAVALGNRTEEVRLFLHPDNLGDHQLHPDQANLQQQSVSVAMRRGDDFFAERCPRADLVKIDTQGAELMVVEGMMQLLKRSGKQLKMIVELTPLSLRTAGGSGAQLVRLLSGLGLPLAIIDHLEHQLVPVELSALVRWCDNVDSYADDRGFMNIFVGEVPNSA